MRLMANRLRELRRIRGLTQEKLGEMVGLTHTSIQRIESNKQQLTEPVVYKLAAALRVHPGELFAPLPATGIEKPHERTAAELCRHLSEDDRGRWFTIGAALGKSRKKIDA